MPNQTLVYALACLRELAKFPGELLEVAKIAQRQAIPLAYCQKILHALAQAGIVSSVRGRGFTLDRSLETITMAEVMMAIEKKAVQVENLDANSLESVLRDRFVAHLKAFPVAEVISVL